LVRFAEKRESCEITEVKGCIPIGLHWRTSATTSSTVFTNRSQAVRLPEAVAFPEGVREVDILKIGRSRVIAEGKTMGRPVSERSAGEQGFHTQREQPPAEERARAG
jgi:antitoxin VapB